MQVLVEVREVRGKDGNRQQWVGQRSFNTATDGLAYPRGYFVL